MSTEKTQPSQKQSFEVIDIRSSKNKKEIGPKVTRTQKIKFWDTIKDHTLQFFIDDWLNHFELGTREDRLCWAYQENCRTRPY